MRQNKKRTARNNKVLSDITAIVRKVRKSISTNDSAKAGDWFTQAVKKLDKAVAAGIMKKNTAARTKSRLAAAVRKLVK